MFSSIFTGLDVFNVTSGALAPPPEHQYVINMWQAWHGGLTQDLYGNLSSLDVSYCKRTVSRSEGPSTKEASWDCCRQSGR